MKNRSIKAQAAALLSLSIGLSSSVFATNLLETYQLASKNDPNWAATKARFLSDRETVKQAYGALLPIIGLTADYGQSETNSDSKSDSSLSVFSPEKGLEALAKCNSDLAPTAPTSPDPTADEVLTCLLNEDLNDNVDLGSLSSSSSSQSSMSISLSQPLFQPASWYRYKAAQRLEKGKEANLALAQQDLILKVSQAYFGVLRAQEEYRLAKTERKSLGTKLDEIKNRYRLGLARDTDLFEMQGTFDLSNAAEMGAQVALDNIKEDLRLLTGQETILVTPLPSDIPVNTPTPLERTEWEEFARANNYQIIAARFALEVATIQVKEKRSGHGPTASFSASYRDAKGDSGSFSSGSQATLFGVSMKIPIYAGGIISSQEKQARHQLAEARHNLNLATRNAIRETRQFHNKVMSDVTTFNARKRSVRSNNSAYRSIKAGYESGTRSLSDVLSAEKRVFSARKELTTARFDYITNTLKLKKSAGILSPDDLSILNSWLDTNANSASFSSETEELSAEDISSILSQDDDQPATYKREKKKNTQHKSLFDAFKAWRKGSSQE